MTTSLKATPSVAASSPVSCFGAPGVGAPALADTGWGYLVDVP